MPDQYQVIWTNGDAEEFSTREAALQEMREAGYVADNGDDDCLVWENEAESVEDAQAIGRLRKVW